MRERVSIVEVGPRDGLQNEPRALECARRVELIRRLRDTGLTQIEAGAFVSPKWVPQMADSDLVLRELAPSASDEVRYPVLVPNAKGYEAALLAGARDIAVFGAASESFSLKNINCTIDVSLERFRPVVASALRDGLRVRGYVSCVLGCPYEGKVAVSSVVRVASALYEMGCREVSLGDTIGVGRPRQAREVLLAVAEAVPMAALAVHFHDTYGMAVANILACLEAGVRVVDAAVAGTGGCPYAKGASGNVATEEVVYLLEGLGMECGVDLGQLAEVGWWLCGELGREPVSKLSRALRAKR